MLQPQNQPESTTALDLAATEIFCGTCGSKNPMGHAFCFKCGSELDVETSSAQTLPAASNGAVPNPASPHLLQTRLAEPYQLNYIEAVTFPFKQPSWISKMWWLPLVPLIPPASFLILRGWRLDITRRIGRRNPDPLPNLSDIGRFFVDGLLLVIMTALYLFPMTVLLFVSGFSWITTALEIGAWILQYIFDNNNAISLDALAAQIGVANLVGLATAGLLPFFYGIFSYPFYRVSMVRYALTGNALAFFDVITNVRLIAKNLTLIMSICFFDLLTTTLFVTLLGLLTPTGIGLLFVLFVVYPLQYSTNGYMFGTLAERINESESHKK